MMKDKRLRRLPDGNCIRTTKNPFLEPIGAGSHVVTCLSILGVELLRRRARTARSAI